MATTEEGTTNDSIDPAELTDEQLEALQREEDGDVGADDTITDDQDADPALSAAAPAPAAPAAPAPSPAPAPAPTTAPAAAPSAGAEEGKVGKIDGVLGKDGKTVIPYSALQAERRAHRTAASKAERLEQELTAARQQIEDLKAGKTPIGDLTEEDVAQMEADFPEQGKRLRAMWDRFQAVANTPAPAPKPTKEDDDPVATTQEVIDQVPLLVEWQTSEDHADKWQRAIDVDTMLKGSPKWAGKPALERFQKVAEIVADEFDVPYEKPKASSNAPAPTPPAPPAAPAAAPTAAAPKEPERRHPETLSDFKTGGATPDHGQIDIRGSNPVALLNKFQDMTDEEIDAQLARLG